MPHISQGNAATHLWHGWLVNNNFTKKFTADAERILKTGWHLAKVQARVHGTLIELRFYIPLDIK